ncbi:MAG: M23 family metallopeptidase [Planctomycetota bacterium]
MRIESLYFESLSPIDARDLGAGARLLVPTGAAFGVPQLIRHGVFWDWVRKEPDRYWIAGDRTSSHSGVDLGFFVRRGAIFQLPAGLPVRAILDGRVKWTGRKSDPESKHGVVLDHGGTRRGFLYSHYADVKQCVKAGRRVKAGDVIGHTVPYSVKVPVVLVHFGVGLHVKGWGVDPWDPSFLLKRWGALMPLGQCFADELSQRKHGVWRAPGEIEPLDAVGRWRATWRSVYR